MPKFLNNRTHFLMSEELILYEKLMYYVFALTLPLENIKNNTYNVA